MYNVSMSMSIFINENCLIYLQIHALTWPSTPKAGIGVSSQRHGPYRIHTCMILVVMDVIVNVTPDSRLILNHGLVYPRGNNGSMLQDRVHTTAAT